MKTLLAILAALLFLAAHASAEQPELADEALVLRWQRDVARVELARRALLEAERAAEASRVAVVTRHKLVDGDSLDAETRVIKRAPKKDVKK